jgi:hypothetical protein
MMGCEKIVDPKPFYRGGDPGNVRVTRTEDAPWEDSKSTASIVDQRPLCLYGRCDG